MSDTPRTDGAQWDARDWDNPPAEMVVSADFARELERELNTAVNSLASLRMEHDELRKEYDEVSEWARSYR